MGLFDGGSAKEVTENEVMNKLRNHPMLSAILAFLDGDISWATKCTGYYDNRKRMIIVGKDSLCIKMNVYNEKANEQGLMVIVEEDPNFEFITYTGFGYMPLHDYTGTNGKVINTSRVLYIWASVIKDSMKERLPELNFDALYTNDNGIIINYTVPPQKWSDWFV